MAGENLEFGLKISMKDPETRKVLEGLDQAKAGTEVQTAGKGEDIDVLAAEASRQQAIRAREQRQRVSRQEEEVESWGKRAFVGAGSDAWSKFSAGTNLQDEIGKIKVALVGALATFLHRLTLAVGSALGKVPGIGRGLAAPFNALGGALGQAIPGLTPPGSVGSQGMPFPPSPSSPSASPSATPPVSMSEPFGDPNGPSLADLPAEEDTQRRPPMGDMFA